MRFQHCTLKQRFHYLFPARGRKPRSLHREILCCLYFITSSPQGDGNQSDSAFCCCRNPLNFITSSPQGDGNGEACWLDDERFISLLFPAGGRKHLQLSTLHEYLRLISLPLPRKGTETILTARSRPPFLLDFITSSPQGDGNISVEPSSSLISLSRLNGISLPLPRKGTETIAADVRLVASPRLFV